MNLDDEQQDDAVEDAVEAVETEGAVEVEEAPSETEEATEELIVQIGDDEPEEQERAPDWVRELRKSNREKDKRIKELEAAQSSVDKPKLAAKPTLESCDYDQAEFEKQLEAWYETKRAVDEEERTKKAEQERVEQAWQGKLRSYEEGKAKLNVPDYEDVEAAVLETFNVTQQGIVVQGADNPALLAYALGKNPTRAKALAAITDPIEFAFAVAKVEASLKVNTKGAPPPEKKLTSSTPGLSATVDGTLERLREEAAKTGDYSKVMAYKKQKRA